ncbi:4-hydroxy-2-oxovalerate aldolase [Geosporobacter ferrireducens]|uniref:4-hydroxy-2-oxovalerate aldolase n=1 Tax=Geosporobacter ferrireducens TaxID=1424294 RepID=A0A1D8GK36_9FIRM|nr:4-hydroxy-2-oxovalerate aldolase [Geosporobacter ferrireducens]AOT71277.1 4-hydroxy-2-oxovalerate aldolase [Geosporobacter ferrireducens]MTI58090.1 4-hydroxy-2-oxovalerate aldolase [Geosporobacter ferrireducens]
MFKQKINIVDTTLRDGSHAVSHGFTVEQTEAIAGGLDKVGVDIIEISHGDGIAGSSINYGFSKTHEMELIKAAKNKMSSAKLAVLLLPGIGTIEDLEEGRENGAEVVRVATHYSEADVGIQHIEYAKKIGMMAVGFLMMAHMGTPEQIVEQARIFVESGADYINIADSAGYMTPDDVRARISLLKNSINIPIGFHAHNNLSLAVANSIAAVGEGATYIDASCRGLGAGAGNTQLEVLSAVLDRMGYNTGMDIYGAMDVAEDIVEPIMYRPQVIKTAPLMLGYAGVYSSFLLHTYKAAERFNLNPRDILVELGKRKMVGGQEDMIVDVAFALSQKK